MMKKEVSTGRFATEQNISKTKCQEDKEYKNNNNKKKVKTKIAIWERKEEADRRKVDSEQCDTNRLFLLLLIQRGC